MSSCSEQPTSALETQKKQDVLSLAKVSSYISGTDITAQLRDELNAGLDVYLPAGHYYVSESINILGYSGTVKGAGKDATIIEVANEFKALPDPILWGFEFTQIFALYRSTGDVTFKDMTILITGDTPAEAHYNLFLDKEVTTIDNAIVVSGVSEEIYTSITVTFKNLKIKGEDSTDPLSHNGKNLIYPLIATGWFGSWTLPSDAVIKNCEIENSGESAVEYMGASGGSGDIKNNKIMNCNVGIWLGNTNPESDVIIKNNIFQKIANDAVDIVSPLWSVCLKNNTLDGVPMTDDCQ